MHMDMSQELVYAGFVKKMQCMRAGQPFCASLRRRNAFGHVRRAVLRRNSQVECRRPRPRACAVEMHTENSQEQFYARIYG